MRYGAVHANGLYNPRTAGQGFAAGCQDIKDLGFTLLKLYNTPDYEDIYSFQTWSDTATTNNEFLDLAEVQAAINLGWETVIFTFFTSDNGTTNWWHADISNTRLDAEYNRVKGCAAKILTDYNNSGIEFVFQNWEGDWAFLDEFVVDKYISREIEDRYLAFLAARQRAVQDARRETPHTNVSIRHAIEVNRVLDVERYPNRKRILRHLHSKIKPDLISYSAYDCTIVDQGSWNSDTASWLAATEPAMRKAFATIRRYMPGIPYYIGEFGYPENEATFEHPGNDIAQMLEYTRLICEDEGCEYFIFWQVYDNEPSVDYTYRGFWLIKPDGNRSISGQYFFDLLT